MQLVRWLAVRDRGFGALRRAARAAIVMPAHVRARRQGHRQPDVATFAAFGSFAMLLLVDFGGPMRERLQAQAALAARRRGRWSASARWPRSSAWLAAVAMALVGFARALRRGRQLRPRRRDDRRCCWPSSCPVSLPGPASSIPDRLAGWGMAAAASLVAIAVLWPAPASDPLRAPAVAACRALAARLRADVAFLLGEERVCSRASTSRRSPRANAAVAAPAPRLPRHALPPDRAEHGGAHGRAPGRRAELAERDHGAVAAHRRRAAAPSASRTCAVKAAAAAVLETGADAARVARRGSRGRCARRWASCAQPWMRWSAAPPSTCPCSASGDA